MRMRRVVGLAFWSLAFLAVAAAEGAQPAPPVANAPSIVFDGSSVVASGLTSGGQAVVFGVAREVQDFVANLVRREEIVTADATGTARYELGRPVPGQSVWVIVDLATGGAATAAPEGFSFVQTDFRGRGAAALASDRDGIADDRSLLDLLVVRPGQGAWSATVGDGGPLDEGPPADGKVEISLAGFKPLGASPAPPARFSGRDVVVAIDPLFLSVILHPAPGVKP